MRIARTRALKNFRDRLGHPVRDLNSIVVGLHAVGTGLATKPCTLSVSWSPSDLHRAEIEARAFAIKSLLVAACDAIDHYLQDLGSLPGPVEDEALRALIRKEPHFEKPAKVLTRGVVESLCREAFNDLEDISSVRTAISTFTSDYLGRQPSKSVRARLRSLYESVADKGTMQARKVLPRKSYLSALELLVAWRNKMVHDHNDEQLGGDIAQNLKDDSIYLAKEHAAIDIARTLRHYLSGLPPTLKDVSTLVSIALRFMAAVDSALIMNCDLSRFLKTSIAYEARRNPKCLMALRRLPGKTTAHRIETVSNLVANHGFVRDKAQTKRGAFAGRVLNSQELSFLEASTFCDLKSNIGI